MSSQPARKTKESSSTLLQLGRQIVRREGEAVLGLAERLDDSFIDALDLIDRCTGAVIVCGIGKAGLIGQKITSTLASTGTRSHFLHPAEAVHGDLGRIHRDDVMLMLSYSGETGEISRLLPSLRSIGVPMIAITGNSESTLGKGADIVLRLGNIDEACSLGLAPSTSTTAMLALGDALALTASRHLGFETEDFARNHPGGSLGQKLAKVEEIMRPLDDCRTALDSKSVRDIFVALSRPGRRTGAIMLIDDEGRLSGLFTDSDLARLFESKRDSQLDLPITEVMATSPTTTRVGTLLPIALETMADRKISELPVIDDDGRPVGLIDVTDILGYRGEISASKPHDFRSATHRAGSPAPATVPFRTNPPRS